MGACCDFSSVIQSTSFNYLFGPGSSYIDRGQKVAYATIETLIWSLPAYAAGAIAGSVEQLSTESLILAGFTPGIYGLLFGWATDLILCGAAYCCSSEDRQHPLVASRIECLTPRSCAIDVKPLFNCMTTLTPHIARRAFPVFMALLAATDFDDKQGSKINISAGIIAAVVVPFFSLFLERFIQPCCFSVASSHVSVL